MEETPSNRLEGEDDQMCPISIYPPKRKRDMDDQDPQKDKQNMVTLASTPEGVQSDYISDKC